MEIERVDSAPSEDEPGALSTRERVVAGLVGTAFGGPGIAAVFLSDNQAGSAVLLVLAAVMWLISVQGTALTRFGSGEHSAEFTRRQAGNQLRAVAAVVEDPAEAVTFARAAEIVSPSPGGRSAVSGRQYQYDVASALDRVASNATLLSEPYGGRFDFILDFGDIKIGVETFGGLLAPVHEKAINRKVNAQFGPPAPPYPVLLLVEQARAGAVAAARDAALAGWNLRPDQLDIVEWSGQRDDVALRAAIQGLVGSAVS